MKYRSNSDKSSSLNFVSGVLILSISTILVKVIGLIYKIPMLKYLGAEGMGYFNSAYEIYALLCVISTAGLPTALSILVSTYRESGNYAKVSKIYKNAFFIFSIFGISGTLFMFLFAKNISIAIENENAFFCIAAISPALLFVCVSSAVRGYFQGFSKMIPTAVSQLIEAMGKLFLGLSFAFYAIKRDYDISIVAAFAVTGLSLLISKLNSDKKIKKNRALNNDLNLCPQTTDNSMKALLKIAVPITLSSAIISSTRIVDMFFIMRRLQDIGYAANVSNEMYGAYTTVAVPIFSLVPSLLTPISLSLVPALSTVIEKNIKSEQIQIVKTAIRITVFFALPSTFAIIVYSRSIISILFSNLSAEISYVVPLLSFLGSSVVFSCMITTTNAILQSYRKTAKPIISMSIGVVVKIILAYILIGMPSVNIYGAPISTFLCDLIITLINLKFISKEMKEKFDIYSVYFKPMVSAILAISLSFIIYIPISLKTGSIKLAFFFASIIVVVSYLVFSLMFKVIAPEDIEMLPMGDKINKFLFNRRFNKKEN